MATQEETVKEFTKQDIDNLVKNEGRAIVIFEGDVFDATDFKVTHPGGPKFIDDHIGEDITELFYDEEHTKIALRLLNEIKIGTLSKSADAQISNSTVHTHTRMKEIADEAWREKIDPKLGTVWQVYTKLDKDEYLNFINDPKHLTRPDDEHRMFQTPFFELFSRTPWYHIGLFWTPVTCYKTYQAWQENTPFELLLYLMLGVFVWTWLEYSLHRFIFHFEQYFPDYAF